MAIQRDPKKTPNNISGLLGILRKNIIMRTVLVVFTLILTVVLVFALTVAWYTNVVQTGGLTFTAESWNFSGEIFIEESSSSIAPGDSGIIGMTLKNESESLVAASVTVKKDQFWADLHSRMFFYIDTPTVRNGETLDRIYVSGKSSYTHVMFPYSELDLTEAVKSASHLHWEWTYDNLGYYVRGALTENGGVVVEDYIRPVTYEYDEMKTTFDAYGNLLTIDGSTTVEQFLMQLSETDGYEGAISLQKTQGGYYPVDVDENNYGVWVYLCNYSEIQKSAMDDTLLGEAQTNLGNISVVVTGQNFQGDGILVNSETELQSVLSTSGVGVVTLNGDVTLTQPIVLEQGARTILNLNGHLLVSSAATIFDAQPGSSLMVYNGSIEGGGNLSTAVNVSGASVTLQDVTVSSIGEGITVYDHRNSLQMDSSIRMIHCTITAAEDALLLYGNGNASDQNTSVTIEDCNFTGNYSGIICNGTYFGSDIHISDTTIHGGYAAIYFPQKDSTLTIENSTLVGYTGLVVKGGYVSVIDSSVVGTGAFTSLPDPSAMPGSGWIDTGDGIYLEANYACTTEIVISGDKTVISGTQENTLAVRQYPSADLSPQASIRILGGRFNSDVSAFLEEGYVSSDRTIDGFVWTVVSKDD